MKAPFPTGQRILGLRDAKGRVRVAEATSLHDPEGILGKQYGQAVTPVEGLTGCVTDNGGWTWP